MTLTRPMGDDRGMRWLAVGEAAIPEGTAWLSAQEAARAATMRFTKRRTEYRLRRLAGKRAVASVLGRPVNPVSLAGIEVLNRRGGAPYVVVDGEHAQVDVSLTDRAGCGRTQFGGSRFGCEWFGCEWFGWRWLG